MPEDNLRKNENQQPIEVDLAETDDPSLTKWGLQIAEPFRKEVAARRIAQVIVFLSGITIILLIWEGFRVIFFSMDKPENAKQLISGAVIPLLEKIATFWTTVFSPLLAFILGYYFGQRQAQRRAGD